MLNYALSGLLVAVITLGVYANAWSKESALLAIVIGLSAERIASAIERRN